MTFRAFASRAKNICTIKIIVFWCTLGYLWQKLMMHFKKTKKSTDWPNSNIALCLSWVIREKIRTLEISRPLSVCIFMNFPSTSAQRCFSHRLHLLMCVKANVTSKRSAPESWAAYRNVGEKKSWWVIILNRGPPVTQIFEPAQNRHTASKNSRNPGNQEQSREILNSIQSLLPKTGRYHRKHRPSISGKIGGYNSHSLVVMSW